MTNDLVNHPPHYNTGEIEVFTYIKDKLTEEEFRGYIKGNILKYVSRERHKGKDDDLRKAQWYMNQYMKHREESASTVGPYGPRSTKRTAPSIMDALTPYGREKIYEELSNENTTSINDKTESTLDEEERSLEDTITQIRERIKKRDTMIANPEYPNTAG